MSPPTLYNHCFIRLLCSVRNLFTAILEPGEKYLIATCPEVPEAAGQGADRAEALRDLAESIQSVLDYRREEASPKNISE